MLDQEAGDLPLGGADRKRRPGLSHSPFQHLAPGAASRAATRALLPDHLQFQLLPIAALFAITSSATSCPPRSIHRLQTRSHRKDVVERIPYLSDMTFMVSRTSCGRWDQGRGRFVRKMTGIVEQGLGQPQALLHAPGIAADLV